MRQSFKFFLKKRCILKEVFIKENASNLHITYNGVLLITMQWFETAQSQTSSHRVNGKFVREKEDFLTHRKHRLSAFASRSFSSALTDVLGALWFDILFAVEDWWSVRWALQEPPLAVSFRNSQVFFSSFFLIPIENFTHSITTSSSLGKIKTWRTVLCCSVYLDAE